MFLGRLINEKGLLELLEASKILTKKKYKFKILILGNHNIKNPNSIDIDLFNQLIKHEKINYLGYKNDLNKYFQISDCVILPSYREGMPRSLLEASASGLPILGSNVSGINELIIDGYNGYTFKPKNYHSTAKVMELFLNLNEKEKKQMGLNARKIVEQRYSVDIVVNSYLNIINEK